MAKSDRVKRQRDAELEAQEQEQVVDQVTEEQEAPKPKKKTFRKVKPTPVMEEPPCTEEIPPEPIEPEEMEEAEQPQDQPQAPEEMTPEEMRQKAEHLKDLLKNEMDRINAQKQRCEDKIKALEEAAEAAEAEERARKEAEEKAKAEAEAREKAEAEARAKAKADLLASVNRAERHVGKAYKWWDYESATWNISTDVWSANMLSDKWEVIYVWYKDGEIERLLNKEELDKYCPR